MGFSFGGYSRSDSNEIVSIEEQHEENKEISHAVGRQDKVKKCLFKAGGQQLVFCEAVSPIDSIQERQDKMLLFTSPENKKHQHRVFANDKKLNEAIIIDPEMPSRSAPGGLCKRPLAPSPDSDALSFLTQKKLKQYLDKVTLVSKPQIISSVQRGSKVFPVYRDQAVFQGSLESPESMLQPSRSNSDCDSDERDVRSGQVRCKQDIEVVIRQMDTFTGLFPSIFLRSEEDDVN